MEYQRLVCFVVSTLLGPSGLILCYDIFLHMGTYQWGEIVTQIITGWVGLVLGISLVVAALRFGKRSEPPKTVQFFPDAKQGAQYLIDRLNRVHTTIEHSVLARTILQSQVETIAWGHIRAPAPSTDTAAYRYMGAWDSQITQTWPSCYIWHTWDTCNQAFPFHPDIIEFLIIDNQEVIVYCTDSSGSLTTCMAIYQQELVFLFRHYYELLWVQAMANSYAYNYRD